MGMRAALSFHATTTDWGWRSGRGGQEVRMGCQGLRCTRQSIAAG